MSDLREALTELVGEAWDDGNARGLDGWIGPNRGAGDVDPEAERAREQMVDRALALRAAHLVEPNADCGCEWNSEDGPSPCASHNESSTPQPSPAQVEITDQAVSVGAERFRMDGHSMLGCDSLSSTEQTVRRILEAAAPLLGPRPLLDRDAAISAIAEASNPDEADLILGRKYVGGWADVFADAVMKLARPMPAREQIDQALAGKPIIRSADKPSDWRGGLSPNEIDDIATIVLGLLNGTES